MILWKIHFFKGNLDYPTGFPTEIKFPIGFNKKKNPPKKTRIFKSRRKIKFPIGKTISPNQIPVEKKPIIDRNMKFIHDAF